MQENLLIPSKKFVFCLAQLFTVDSDEPEGLPEDVEQNNPALKCVEV